MISFQTANASIATASIGINVEGETTCGDGTCAGSESCSNCLSDCGCSSGYECKSGQCEKEGSGGSSGGGGSSYTLPLVVNETNETEEINESINLTYVPPSVEEEINITENDSKEAPPDGSEADNETTITEPNEPIPEEKSDIVGWVLFGLLSLIVLYGIIKESIYAIRLHPKRKPSVQFGLYRNGKPLLQNFQEINKDLKEASKELKESIKEYKNFNRKI